jgi:hypothetical protein
MTLQGLAAALRGVAGVSASLFVLSVLLCRSNLQVVGSNAGAVVAQVPDVVLLIEKKGPGQDEDEPVRVRGEGIAPGDTTRVLPGAICVPSSQQPPGASMFWIW